MRSVVLLAAVLAPVLAPSPAAAYELKRSSNGAQLHWGAGEIELAFALDPAPADFGEARSVAALDAAVATWQDAVGERVQLVTGPSTVAARAHDGDDGLNQVRWAVDADDADIEAGVLGLTFVSYRVSDGLIRDADIVFNGVNFLWTDRTAGCVRHYDLESAATHELGHLLGLGHSPGNRDATMFPTGDACEFSKRDLATDDLAGVTEIYANLPAATDDDSDGLMDSVGCQAGGATGGGGGALVLGVALLLALRPRTRLAALAVAGALAAPSLATASTLRRLAPADLGAQAVIVVRGWVTGTRAAADRTFATETTVVVGECLAGSCPPAVTVRTRGGEIGDRGLWVDSEAHPVVGSEVVLYLRNDRRGNLRVLGGVQGAYTVDGDRATRDLREHTVEVAGRRAAGQLESVTLAALRASLPAR